MIRRRHGRRIGFAVLTFAGLMFMAEAAVSVFGRATLVQWEAPVPVTHTGAPYLPGNPFLLWEMVAGDRKELGVDVSVNTHGFRGPPIQTKKAEGVRRILLLGDSSVYGHGVGQQYTFAHHLNNALGPSIEVINLGVPGYSSAQSLNLLELRGWELEPDLIVVASLWSDNNFDAFVDKELLSEQLAFSGGWMGSLSRVLTHSALYRWLDWKLRLARRAETVTTVGWILGQTPTGGLRRVEVNDYADNLLRFADEAALQNSAVMYMSLANSVDLGAPTDGAIAWTLYREVMESVAAHTGSPFFEVVPVFEASGADWADLFIDELHPSQKGHKLIADALEKELTQWVQSGSFGLVAQPQESTVWDDPFSRGEGPPPNAPGSAPVTLSGQVIGAPTGMPIQIDLINLTPGRTNADNPMLGSARFDHVDSFEMPAPQTGMFGLRLYIDREGDGPSRGDPVHEFITEPIEATGSSISGLVIDIESGSIRWVNTQPTNRRPRPKLDATD